MEELNVYEEINEVEDYECEPTENYDEVEEEEKGGINKGVLIGAGVALGALVTGGVLWTKKKLKEKKEAKSESKTKKKFVCGFVDVPQDEDDDEQDSD